MNARSVFVWAGTIGTLGAAALGVELAHPGAWALLYDVATVAAARALGSLLWALLMVTVAASFGYLVCWARHRVAIRNENAAYAHEQRIAHLRLRERAWFDQGVN